MKQLEMDKTLEKLCLLLLFLFAISFLNLGGYIVCAVFVVFLFAVARYPLRLDQNFFVLFFFSVFYYGSYAIHWGFGVKELIWYLLGPWWSYLCGKWFAFYAPGKHPLRTLVLTLAGGFFAHGMLNVIAFLSTYGLTVVLSTSYRITMDFWRRDLISVTASSLYYVPLMTLAVGYLFCGGQKKRKVLAWAVIVMGVAVNLLYANRTAFVILAMLFGLGVWGILFKKNSAKAWLAVAGLVAALVLIWSLDIGNLRSWTMSLQVFERFTSGESGRFQLWVDFLTDDWWRYPLGGEKIGIKSVHNLWLDTLRTVGILPFVLLVVFTVLSFLDLRRFNESGIRGARGYIYMVLGIMLSCAVEPIMSANPYYVMLWVMVIGGINGAMERAASLPEPTKEEQP